LCFRNATARSAQDSGYFGGYVRPANLRTHRADRRFLENQSGKRKAVVVIRERDGSTLPAVFRTEGQALNWVRARIAKGYGCQCGRKPELERVAQSL
jgi:hypothetical protein